MSKAGRFHQRSASLLVYGVNGRSQIQQQGHRFRMVPGSRKMQGGVALLLDCVNRQAMLGQKLDYARGSGTGGEM
jgi:hypothetical protein